MGGSLLLKLNIDSRPIANKYREGKVKRTLERELKAPEIAKREANETSSLRRNCRWISGSPSAAPKGLQGVLKWTSLVFFVVMSQRQLGVRLRQPTIPVVAAAIAELGLGILPRLRTACELLTFCNRGGSLRYS